MSMYRQLWLALVLSTLVMTGVPGDLVWSTDEVLTKGASRTYNLKGTRKGEPYIFRARGECRWLPRQIYSYWGPIYRERPDRIFGIDFRVEFGQQQHQFLEVGEAKIEQTEIRFVADRDDMSLHVYDGGFGLPDHVVCAIDGLEVVSASPQD